MGHFVGDEVGLVSAPVYVVVGRRATQAPLPGSLILADVTVSPTLGAWMICPLPM